jgi:hypothetical protein
MCVYVYVCECVCMRVCSVKNYKPKYQSNLSSTFAARNIPGIFHFLHHNIFNKEIIFIIVVFLVLNNVIFCL